MKYPFRLAASMFLGMLFFLPNTSGQDQAEKSRIRAAHTLAKRIDSKLKFRRDVPVGELSSDGEFMRRVMLDLTGSIPTATAAREFILDRSDLIFVVYDFLRGAERSFINVTQISQGNSA